MREPDSAHAELLWHRSTVGYIGYEDLKEIGGGRQPFSADARSSDDQRGESVK